MKKNFVLTCLILLITFFSFGVKAEAKIIDDYKRFDYSSNVNDNFDHNCEDFAPTIRIGGYLITLVKVLIPIILIVKASLSLASVVTKGSPDELKKQVQKFGTAVIAGIAIFFIPLIVNTIFGFISRYNDNITYDSQICSACLFTPFSSSCTDYIPDSND